jgi:hypothetical protein
MAIFDPTKTPREIKDIVLDCIDHYHLSPTSFAHQCGFRGAEKIHHITTARNKPSFETLQSIVVGFPDLNMDRFIRGTGPILLADLCLNNVALSVVSPNGGVAPPDGLYEEIITGKDKLIDSLEKQVVFLQKLLDK